MRKCLLLFILITFTQVVFAQFLDNFSDGEFANNPIWSGNAGVFEVDSTFKLHLNDMIIRESFLATESNVSINAMQFGMPDSSLENDIIINEILFNPKDDFSEDGTIERFKQVVVLSR